MNVLRIFIGLIVAIATSVIPEARAATYAITPNPGSVSEGAGSLTFTVTRSGTLPAETIYASTVQSEGYTNSGDYTGVSNQAVTFTANQTQQTVAVSITNDSTVENNETFAFIVQRNASDPVTTYLAKTTFTITDNDTVATTYAITPNPGSVSEGAGSLTFTVTRSGGLPAETIYASTVQSEGYTNSSDYTGVSNQAVTFTANQTQKTVAVTITNDSTVENNETFAFIVQRNSSDPVTTYLAKTTFTITDDDTLATTYAITPNPGSVSEGAGSLTFTVTRSGGLPAETIYASTVQSEGYTNSSDYTGVSNQAVTFTANQTQKTVAVTITNDSTVENNETFAFIVQRNSSDPVTTYLDKTTFTITDDDTLATTYAITPNPGSVSEGAGSLTFTVTRSGGLPAETIYASTVQSEGYTNSSDYTGVSNQAVTFTANQTQKTVAVTITNDSTVENNETFAFIVQRNSSDPVTTYLDKTTFTITDDDTLATTYAITPNPGSVSEGAGSLTFTVTRSGGLPAETIYASTVQSEGYTNSSDYTGVSNQAVTFTANQTQKTVAVTITNDSTVENNETFAFIVQRNSSDPVTTYLAKTTFTITDDDTLATTYAITPNPATVGEGAGALTFTVTRSGTLPAETIYASTVQSEGYTNSGDYTGVSNQAVTFTANQTQKTVAVTITNDSTVENNETFAFIVQRNSSDPVTTYLAKTTFTITDDDTLATTYAITPNPATVGEGAGALTFTVTRSGTLPAETIYASTVQSEGYTNSGDYTGVSNQAVTFSSNQTQQTVAVSITNDTTVESNETFAVIVQRNASDPVTTHLAKSTFTITDNDTSALPDFVVSSLTLNPTSGEPNDSVTVTLTVRNNGSGTGPSGTTCRIRLASSTTISVSDPLLDEFTVGALAANGGQQSFTRTVTIPSGTAAGSRYIGATANALLSGPNETDTTNNQRTTPFTVNPTDTQLPDFVVSALTSNPMSGTAGTLVTVIVTVRNAGPGSAPAGTTCRIRLASAGTITTSDPLLDEFTVGGLAANGGQQSFTRTVTIPAGTSSGSRYIGATANALLTGPNETDVTNNQRTVPFTIADSGPESTRALGLDVSHARGNISWPIVASRAKFAIIKATDGYRATQADVMFTDSQFSTNAAAARQNRMIVGAYHFARPYLNSAKEEADFFLSVAGAYVGPGFLPPALDIEDPDDELPNHPVSDLGSVRLSQWVREWCAEIERVKRVKPMLYMTPSVARTLMESDLAKYPLWIAFYERTPDVNPSSLGPWGTNWTFLQYSVQGHTLDDAIQTPPVDLDVFNGDASTLATYVGGGSSFDTAPPKITTFRVTPASASLGQGFTVSYTISDTGGSQLKQVELWRANVDGTSTDPSWTQIGRTIALSGNGPTNGSFPPDTPSAAGNYWYGLHVVDGADNYMNERVAGIGPRAVVLTPPSTAQPPLISSLNPNPLIGSNSSQQLSIFGSNFADSAKVVLRRSSGTQAISPTINSVTAGEIVVSYNFTTVADTWLVEVINPDGLSSGQNTLFVSTPLDRQPDIELSNIVLSSSSVAAGELISVNWTTKNNGPGRASGGTTKISITETNGSATSSDISLGSLTLPVISASAALDQTASFSVPARISTGAYYVRVMVSGVPGETITTNNEAVSPPLNITAVPQQFRIPTIRAISPSSIIGSARLQSIHISGADFASGLTVRFRNITTGKVTVRKTKTVRPDQLAVSMIFGSLASDWTVAIINPDGRSSGDFHFNVLDRANGFTLRFPLAGVDAYTARISSVFDHAMRSAYTPTTDQLSATYGMVTYTDERGSIPDTSSTTSIKKSNGQRVTLYSFQKSDGSAFSVNGQYDGTGDKSSLNYDSHPGYDYPAPKDTPVYASGDGIVYVISDSVYHTFYINHGNGYFSYYLHCSVVPPDGKRVKAGDPLGKTGNAGVGPNNYHLHFEVRKKVNSTAPVYVDPYGWESPDANEDPYIIPGVSTVDGINIPLWTP